MALTPSIFPAEFRDSINAFCSINESGIPIIDNNGIPIDSQGDYPSAFAASYETYSLSGEVLGAVHGAQEPGILESFLRTFNDSVIDFATALANYWATVLIVPGAPAHGGVSVVSVVNNAASQVSAFQQAILASIWNSGGEFRPVFQHLIENIEAIALPSVTWTVTELMPDGSTQNFPENVF